jgi:hypothetical protein
LPSIPDEFDAAAKNAIALRNQCAVDGVYPTCGAEPELSKVAPLVYFATFKHEFGCPVALNEDAA